MAITAECISLLGDSLPERKYDVILLLFWIGSFAFLCACTGLLFATREKTRWSDLATDDAVLRYTGVSKHLPGCILKSLWKVYVALGFAQMALLCFSEYEIFQFVTPVMTWVEMAYLYGWLLLTIFPLLILYGMYTNAANEFFMKPTDVSVCDEVLVSGDGENHFMVDVHLNADGVRCFECCCLRFFWCDKQERFRTYMTQNVTAAQAQEALNQNGLTPEMALEISQFVGPNRINVYIPTKMEALVTAFLAPTFICQFATVELHWFYATWNVGFCIFFLIVGLTVHRALFVVRKNQVKLDQMANHPATVTVLRSVPTKINYDEIVPGDVILIDEATTVPCDCMVISGSAVVNESALTGEPMPIAKIPGNIQSPDVLAAETHSKHFLYMGTHVMQSADGPIDGRVAALAISTGGLTCKGQLLRKVLFPCSLEFKFERHFGYAIQVLALLGMTCFVMSALQSHQEWVVGAFSGLYALMCALDPNVPNAIMVAQGTASKWLEQMGVRCLIPAALPVAGKVTACVFDKTGTITKDGVDFIAVHSVVNKEFGKLVDMTSDRWWEGVDELIKQALGVCHTVTKLEKCNELVGNHVEVSMVEASGWTIGTRDSMTVHPPAGMTCGSLDIVRQLQFNHERMTSGCVVRTKEGKYLVFVKGAYENIAAISRSVPSDYKELTHKYAGEQYYVLGLGVKELPADAPVESMTLDELEHGIDLLGLLLFRNELKEDSVSAMQSLREANIRCVMCTGDNHLTGAEVARKIGMFHDDMRQVMLDVVDGKLVFLTRSGESIDEPKDYSKVETILTAPAFRHVYESGAIKAIMPTARVFARAKPDDKVKVVQLFQEMGCVTGMVGDGGNDCGALRAANIGFAFSNAEASLVSPFSTGGESLWRVNDVIRVGRACLATQVSTTTWFMCAGFLVGPSFWYLLNVLDNMTLSEVSYLVQTIVLPIGFTAFMTSCKPGDVLSKIRPSASLIGARGFLNVVSTFLFFLCAAVTAFSYLWSQDNYCSGDIVTVGVPSEKWVLRGDNSDTATLWLIFMTQLLTVGISFSFGAEHRQSVYRNKSLVGAYATFMIVFVCLIWSQDTVLHTLFRINCSNAASVAHPVPLIAWFSTGPIGGCFLGPQIHDIYAQQLNEGVPFMLPTPANGCVTRLGATEPADLNNYFSDEYRLILTSILVIMSVSTLSFHWVLQKFHPRERVYFERM